MTHFLEDALEIAHIARNQDASLPAIVVSEYTVSSEIGKKFGVLFNQHYPTVELVPEVETQIGAVGSQQRWTNTITLGMILMNAATLTKRERVIVGRILANKVRQLKTLRLWDSGAEPCILNNILR